MIFYLKIIPNHHFFPSSIGRIYNRHFYSAKCAKLINVTCCTSSGLARLEVLSFPRAKKFLYFCCPIFLFPFFSF
ncbi:hypothetical protein I7I50_06471 [Histoplasma capsulatum G186AR]|uniref:Uncharacterized protein n=1 Tax=Ajellomyces capsulatus TaxID=5037 RepID=A0A8H7Z2K3_AJECA|nr:hypothetical protein I7I52_10457 [Histoplasma capsulatum]QSS67403.1 hypothetical protein I7I50_06471 [Histoplasma capsulatum G186AR]